MQIFIGFDGREAVASAVLAHSIQRRARRPVAITDLALAPLRAAGLYGRPTERRDGRLFDTLSGAPMATEFALSRFLVPHLAAGDWALFCDSDMLCLGDITQLFALADPRYAVMCVQHDQPDAGPGATKMDGQAQLPYPRKNWSSLMLWNCRHPAHRGLTLDLINTAPGRALHRFCWLEDRQIGALPLAWNWLEGISPPLSPIHMVHFTRGGPWFPAYRQVAYGDLWRRELARMTGGLATAVTPAEAA